MSESQPADPTAPPSEASSKAADVAASGAAPRRRRWLRRLRNIAIVAVAAGLLFRGLLGYVIFPYALSQAAATANLDVDYERIHLSVFGGDVGLSFVTARPRDGGEVIAQGRYVRLQISTRALLRARLVIYRVDADDLTIDVERLADGSIPVLDLVAGRKAAPPEVAAAAPPPGPAVPA